MAGRGDPAGAAPPEDSAGNGCGWYSSFPCACGGLDDSDFSAADACCACEPAPARAPPASAPGCADAAAGAADLAGHGCAFYELAPCACGALDDTDFSAHAACCACAPAPASRAALAAPAPAPHGLGAAQRALSRRRRPSPSSPASPSPSASTLATASTARRRPSCTDSSYGAMDSEGNGCNWYTSTGYCGSYDDNDFTARQMCCRCKATVASDAEQQSRPGAAALAACAMACPVGLL